MKKEDRGFHGPFCFGSVINVVKTKSRIKAIAVNCAVLPEIRQPCIALMHGCFVYWLFVSKVGVPFA